MISRRLSKPLYLILFFFIALETSCGKNDSDEKQPSNSTKPATEATEATEATNNEGRKVETPSKSSDDVSAPNPSTILTSLEGDVLKLTNSHRESLGLEPLEINLTLQEQAKEHSDGMAKGLVPFGHQGFNDRSQKIANAINIQGIAENVAINQASAASVMKSWLNSSGHRYNIEGNYRIIGISAMPNEQGLWYYTQIFAN